MTLKAEISHNFLVFQQDWQRELSGRISDLPSHAACLEQSYVRLTTLQAWRSNLIETKLCTGSLAFFAEAQNDALISHVQASLGSWRVALKALRSCIENILMCLYYKDHSIELALWEKGKFRLGVSESIAYFQKHPLVSDIDHGLSGLEQLSSEYGKLSIAVHGSAVNFRMTDDGKAVSLWKMDKKYLGIWASHEKEAIAGINSLMLVLFREHLEGSKLPALRQSLALVIPSRKDSDIKAALNVSLKR